MKRFPMLGVPLLVLAHLSGCDSSDTDQRTARDAETTTPIVAEDTTSDAPSSSPETSPPESSPPVHAEHHADDGSDEPVTFVEATPADEDESSTMQVTPTAEVVPPPPGNLFENPGFESGRDAWWSFAAPREGLRANTVSWADYEISSDVAYSGEQAALLRLDSTETDNSARIYGVIQEFDEREFPRYLSGWYRVEDWQRGTTKQYVQIVVIAWRPNPMPPTLRAGNFQIAYTLAGVAEPPLRIANRRFIMNGPVEPVEDEWIFFEFDLHKDFREQWRTLPSNYEFVRVLFEVRYDEKEEAEPPASGRVYYDDLYIGPASRAPTGTKVTLPAQTTGGG